MAVDSLSREASSSLSTARFRTFSQRSFDPLCDRIRKLFPVGRLEGYFHLHIGHEGFSKSMVVDLVTAQGFIVLQFLQLHLIVTRHPLQNLRLGHLRGSLTFRTGRPEYRSADYRDKEKHACRGRDDIRRFYRC